MNEDFLRVRSLLVDFYVLKEGESLYLIDTGFLFGVSQLKRALKRKGWGDFKIKGIFLTHGHLDHAYNVAQIKKETGAWVAVSEKDLSHCKGEHVYKGASKVCGLLEALGRWSCGYEAFEVDRMFEDGDELGVWGDLVAIGTPGHTQGHTSFYSPSRRIAFSGDLFASLGSLSHWPPGILNSCPEFLEESRRRLLELDIIGVYPNHSDGAAGGVHLDRLKRLSQRC